MSSKHTRSTPHKTPPPRKTVPPRKSKWSSDDRVVITQRGEKFLKHRWIRATWYQCSNPICPEPDRFRVDLVSSCPMLICHICGGIEFHSVKFEYENEPVMMDFGGGK